MWEAFVKKAAIHFTSLVCLSLHFILFSPFDEYFICNCCCCLPYLPINFTFSSQYFFYFYSLCSKWFNMQSRKFHSKVSGTQISVCIFLLWVCVFCTSNLALRELSAPERLEVELWEGNKSMSFVQTPNPPHLSNPSMKLHSPVYLCLF